MRLARAFGLAGTGVLGAAVVVLPAVAGSETTPPGVVAENVGLYSHYWTPASVTVDPGGTVEFSNPTEVPHGIRWVSTPAGVPECAGVPVGEATSGTKWKGTCSFGAAGTYTYYCTVHGAAMSGTIKVGASTSTGTETTPTTPSTGTTTTSGGTPTTTGPGTTSTGVTQGSGGTPTSVLSATKISSARHGSAVQGSLRIGQQASGGTLTVLLTAKLGGRRVTVGRTTRAYLSAGAQTWTVALSARARRTLRAKGRLALTVRLTLTPPGGVTSTLTRTLTLRR